MNRQVKVELLVAAIYLAMFLCQDHEKATLNVARAIRWYGRRCTDLGNWAWTQGIRAENAYKELIAP